MRFLIFLEEPLLQDVFLMKLFKDLALSMLKEFYYMAHQELERL